MSEETRTCYMCDAPATGYEHVPPRCLFPEKKDLPVDADLRRNLLTVPSCDAHNSQKSKDDEYLLYVLGSCMQINDVGRNHYRSKIRRAIERNPSILGKIASATMPGSCEDSRSGDIVHAVAFAVDAGRLNPIIDKLGRAIYFCHFKKKYMASIRYQAEFLFATADQSDEANSPLGRITRQADELFSNVVSYGDNPEVFRYQAIEGDSSRRMRLHFYDACKLLLIFNR